MKALTQEHWQPNMTILEVVLEILSLLRIPDDSKQFFKDNKFNEQVYELYKNNKHQYDHNVVQVA